MDILIYLAFIMTAWGVFGVMASDNIRRALCYLLVAQTGFILPAIGIGTDDAISSAGVSAAIHIIYFALLFAIISRLILAFGKNNFSDIADKVQLSRLDKLIFLLPFISITGLVFSGGFIAKKMFYGLPSITLWLEICLMAMNVLVTVASFKFLWFFLIKTRKSKYNLLAKDMAIVLLSLATLAAGLLPDMQMGYLNLEVGYSVKWGDVLKQFFIIIPSAALIFMLVKDLKIKKPKLKISFKLPQIELPDLRQSIPAIKWKHIPSDTKFIIECGMVILFLIIIARHLI